MSPARVRGERGVTSEMCFMGMRAAVAWWVRRQLCGPATVPLSLVLGLGLGVSRRTGGLVPYHWALAPSRPPRCQLGPHVASARAAGHGKTCRHDMGVASGLVDPDGEELPKAHILLHKILLRISDCRVEAFHPGSTSQSTWPRPCPHFLPSCCNAAIQKPPYIYPLQYFLKPVVVVKKSSLSACP